MRARTVQLGFFLALTSGCKDAHQLELPSEGLVLFVGECPHSWDLFERVRSRHLPEVVPVPVFPTLDARAREVCDFSLELLDAPFSFWASPDDRCEQLRLKAVAYHREHFVKYPAFSLNGRPVERSEEATIKVDFGLASPSVKSSFRVATPKTSARVVLSIGW